MTTPTGADSQPTTPAPDLTALDNTTLIEKMLETTTLAAAITTRTDLPDHDRLGYYGKFQAAGDKYRAELLRRLTAPDRTTPSDPQVTARGVISEWMMFESGDEAATSFELTDRLLARLASAGLVITAPDAPAQRVERTSEALTNFYSFVNTLGAPDAPSGDQVTISAALLKELITAAKIVCETWDGWDPVIADAEYALRAAGSDPA